MFRRNGIDLVLNSRVAEVGRDSVSVINKEGVKEELPFGACVWATGERAALGRKKCIGPRGVECALPPRLSR